MREAVWGAGCPLVDLGGGGRNVVLTKVTEGNPKVQVLSVEPLTLYGR